MKMTDEEGWQKLEKIQNLYIELRLLGRSAENIIDFIKIVEVRNDFDKVQKLEKQLKE